MSTFCLCSPQLKLRLTSFRVTGFSRRETCVSLGKFFKGSRSASSTRLFAVRTRFVRLGIELARLGWMLETRFRARRRVRRRGERGKLAMVVISLSVKSMAS